MQADPLLTTQIPVQANLVQNILNESKMYIWKQTC